MATSTLASSTHAAAPPRRLARGRVPRLSPTRGGTRGGRDARVVAGAADPSASLPQALIDAVSKKFEEDVPYGKTVRDEDEEDAKVGERLENPAANGETSARGGKSASPSAGGRNRTR